MSPSGACEGTGCLCRNSILARRGHSIMRTLAVVGVTLLVALVIAGCSQTAKVLNRPLPEVVGQTTRSGFSGLDYTV